MVNNEIQFGRKCHFLAIIEEADTLESKLRNVLTPIALEQMQMVFNMKMWALAGLAKEGVIEQQDVREVQNLSGERYLELDLDGKNYQFEAGPARKILLDQVALPDIHSFLSDNNATTVPEIEQIPAPMEAHADNNIESDFEEFGFEEDTTLPNESDLTEMSLLEKELRFEHNSITVTKQISKKKTEDITFNISVAPIGSNIRKEKQTPFVVFVENTKTKEYICDVSEDGDPIAIEMAGCGFTVSGCYQRGEFSSVIDTEEIGHNTVTQCKPKKIEAPGHIVLNAEDVTLHVFPVSSDSDDYVVYMYDSEGNSECFSNRNPLTFTAYDEDCTVDAGWEGSSFSARIVSGEDAEMLIEEAEYAEEEISLEAEATPTSEKTEEPLIKDKKFQILANAVLVSGLALGYSLLKTNGIL